MNPLGTLWSDLPLPAELTAVLAAVVIVVAIAFPHVRRARQRRQWRKLPPPPKKVEIEDVVLRLPRRGPGGPR
ncbi:MAG TPA: hypothetical protein VLT83_03365 [Opitutaceae bacterium]|nr:hypothetical protein [Opitutaceae bacterium]